MLFSAVVLGTVLCPVVAFVGVPIAAAGIAGLVYRGRTALAVGAAVAGVAATGAFSVSNVAYAAPVLTVVILAVLLLRTWSLQPVAAILVAVLALAGVAADALYALSRGTTLLASVSKQSHAVVAEMGKAMGNSASSSALAGLDEAAKFVESAWPSTYFQSAVFISALVVVSIVWAARRVDNPLDVGSVSTLDLSPHILWAFVVGLFLLAVSYLSFAASGLVGVVGLNLVLCARTLFFLQGFGVVAGVLDRSGVRFGGRILALAGLILLDAFTLFVSFIGLLDFWVNFRRVPREGVTPATAEPDGRRW